jgi:hypothetical protein
MHRYAQDFSRLHFGLGGADTIESIIVNWPSGNEQTLSNVEADQIITIVEVPEPTREWMILASACSLFVMTRSRRAVRR